MTVTETAQRGCGVSNHPRRSPLSALVRRWAAAVAVGSLAVALEISNLTNRPNQCCVDVEVEDVGTPDEFIVVEDQFWPGLLPSLGIEWSW